MQRSDFSYELPPERIAQQPLPERSASRMLLLERASGEASDRMVRELPELLAPGDLLVLNDTRVVAARLKGTKLSGGQVEVFLERPVGACEALVQLRASKPIKPGLTVTTAGGAVEVLGREDDLWRVRLPGAVFDFFDRWGEVPLPPYIHRAADESDQQRYQTVFARERGAVAAPTASLHFDQALLSALEARGIERAFVTLHVGAGTFQPVRADDIEEHVMHAEWATVSEATCQAVHRVKAAGRRVVAVGTTVVRALESAAAQAASAVEDEHRADATKATSVDHHRPQKRVVARQSEAQAIDPSSRRPAGPGSDPSLALAPWSGETRLFIRPGFRFRVIDALLTNFHLPESTLLMLVCAFGGQQPVLRAYRHAVEAGYRFFSYGDAMFLR